MLPRRRVVRRRRPRVVSRKRVRVARRPMRYMRKRVSPYVKVLSQPVPPKMLTKLNYVEKISLTSSAGLIAMYQWRSSLYDPNLTGGGHQPMYYDQYTPNYNSYIVHGMKYKISLSNTGNPYGAFVALMEFPNGYTASASIQTDMERRFCRKKQYLTALGQQGSRFYTSGYIDIAKNNGLSRSDVLYTSGYKSAVTTNPSYYSTVALEYEGDSGGSTSLLGIIQITYYCEFLDRVEVAGS